MSSNRIRVGAVLLALLIAMLAIRYVLLTAPARLLQRDVNAIRVTLFTDDGMPAEPAELQPREIDHLIPLLSPQRIGGLPAAWGGLAVVKISFKDGTTASIAIYDTRDGILRFTINGKYLVGGSDTAIRDFFNKLRLRQPEHSNAGR